MKFAFFKKLNAKIIAIIAVALVLVVGGGTAIALATANTPKTPELSEQEAKAAVFSHAGITEQDVLSLHVDKGTENGLPVYEIDFKTAEKSYDYDIVRNSGEILHSSYDVLGSGNVPGKTETENTSPVEETLSTPAPSNSASPAITKDQAKSIALEDAGVAESDTQFIWIEEDYEDGRSIYDVEFFANGTEYDYEIDCSTGRIISSDFDIEHYTPDTGNSAGTGITLDEARSIALAKVPGATTSDIRIHLDRDDGYQIYEGEIYYNRMEYEFEIDASTGTIIEWSVEHWD